MSHIARLFVEDALQAGLPITLPDGQSKYLLRVMRLSEGALVRAFNGADGEWACKLSIDGKNAVLSPERQTRAQEAAPALTLLFAPIKRSRTEFIIEKATELGVSEIQPVFTEHTQVSRIRVDRFALISTEAAEQTERLDIPQINEAISLPKALAEWGRQTPLIYCDEGSESAPLTTHLERLIDQPCGLLVGPEGGFSSKEREMLRACDFVIPITLGPRILRAETAVVSALTLWQSLVGDWQTAPYLPET